MPSKYAFSCMYKMFTFMRFSFRFIVRPSGDYTVQAVDPDVPIEWTDVEQVVST
jgi:hypothetical protein